MSTFSFRNQTIPLFDSPYNTTINNERGVEIPLAASFVNKLVDKNEDFIEIGCVTPYYFLAQNRKLVIDPTDTHEESVKHDALDYEFYGKNILSISTIEHVGFGDYGLSAEHGKAIKLLNKILLQSKLFFLTIPFGFNLDLDKYILSDFIMNYRHIFFFERKADNRWEHVAIPQRTIYPYYNGHGASSIVVLSNLL